MINVQFWKDKGSEAESDDARTHEKTGMIEGFRRNGADLAEEKLVDFLSDWFADDLVGLDEEDRSDALNAIVDGYRGRL